jgi:hypothetical protein
MRYFIPLKGFSSGLTESVAAGALWLEGFVVDGDAGCVGLAAFD